MSGNLNKNTIYNTIKTVSGIIYPLITFPYISRVLMPENVGKINFGNSVVSYFMLIASLGVTTYAIRECSKVRENREELERTASQILSINILSTLIAYIALALTLIVARPLDNYRELICIQSATIIFTTLGADWINSAMEDFRFIAMRTVGMQIVSLILMFVFVRRPEDYIIFAIISVVASSGANIINIFYRHRFCKTRFTFDIEWKKHTLPILMLFSMILAQTIYCNSDMTMLGLMRGDYEVGLYSTSVKIYNLVNQVIASIAWVVMPQLSASFVENDYERINDLLRYALSFIVVLGCPCLIGLNVVAKPIIETVGGPAYLGASVSLHILTLALICSIIGGWIGNMIMIPAGRESICLKSGVISAIVNVILNFMIIPIWGMNGAAFTTFIAELTGFFVVFRYMDKNIRIRNVWEVFKAPIVGSVLVYLVGLTCVRYLSSALIITVVTVGISMPIYAITLYILRNELFCGYADPIIKKLKRRT